MAPLARVLFIGVDAGDRDLILDWSARGLLPSFSKLLERSAVGSTRNPTGLYVGAIWPSFYTGLSPAAHGRYCFEQLVPGTYERRRIAAHEVRGEPFWNAQHRAGKRVAVIDVPKCAPSRALAGVHVVDWAAHDPEPEGLRTWPESLAAEIVERFGRDPVGNCNAEGRGAADYVRLRDDLVRRARAKAELSAWLLEQGGWDGFYTTFAESHCVGHQCWHLHDATHPRHDPELAARLGDPLLDVYRAIDAGIGALLARVGEETTVIVLASHGMGPHYDGTFLLDEVLRRLAETGARRAATSLVRSVWQRLPRRFRRLLRGASRDAKRSSQRRAPFFRVPNNDAWGAIRINLEGREPEGVVRAGEDCERVCAELSRDLLQLENVETGAPLVRRVLRTHELYEGPEQAHLPDLLVEWNRESPISAVRSPRTGLVRGAYEKCRTGDHTADGLFLAAGPGIRPKRLAESVAVEDFAPTFSELLGVPPPAGDGRSFLPLLRAR